MLQKVNFNAFNPIFSNSPIMFCHIIKRIKPFSILITTRFIIYYPYITRYIVHTNCYFQIPGNIYNI